MQSDGKPKKWYRKLAQEMGKLAVVLCVFFVFFGIVPTLVIEYELDAIAIISAVNCMIGLVGVVCGLVFKRMRPYVSAGVGFIIGGILGLLTREPVSMAAGVLLAAMGFAWAKSHAKSGNQQNHSNEGK